MRHQIVQAVLCPLTREFMTLECCRQCPNFEEISFVRGAQIVECNADKPLKPMEVYLWLNR